MGEVATQIASRAEASPGKIPDRTGGEWQEKAGMTFIHYWKTHVIPFTGTTAHDDGQGGNEEGLCTLSHELSRPFLVS